MKKKRKRIDHFEGVHAFLSNFYPCRVKFRGVEFRSLEHAYQASKTDNPFEHLRIAGMTTAKEAKQYGNRNLYLPKDWEGRKVGVMRRLIAKKFREDSDLADLLVRTFPAKLVEGNWWGDKFWGVCQGEGKNMLGRLLMQRRKFLRLRT